MGVIGPSQRNLRRWGMTSKPTVDNTSSKPTTQNEIKSSIDEKVISKETNNMKGKKINIFATNGQHVFLNKYGISTLSLKNITLNLGNNKQVEFHQLFKAPTNGDRFESLNGCDILSFLNNEEWDKETYYIKDETKANRNGYYGYGYGYNNLIKGQEKSVKIKSIKITFEVNYYYDFVPSRQQRYADYDITIKSKKQMNDYNVWLLENFKFNELRKPDFSEIQIDKEFYCTSHGLARVIKVYDYPNKKNLICDVETETGKVTIDTSCANLYYLPYDMPKSKLCFLDKCDNELSLLPYVIREGQTFNVYWKQVDDAAQYIVSLYKIIEVNGRKDLYHLNDYSVDRNEKMFVISGLIGNTFVFKVAAEDRSGKTIALSRGIVNGYPKYLVEEE